MINQLSPKKLENSIPVSNSRKVLGWICDRSVLDFQKDREILTSDLRTALSNTFGQHNFARRSEFNLNIWVVEHEGLSYNIFSAARMGTSIEIIGKSHTDVNSGSLDDQIIKFLEELSDKIN